jgi:SnoaL-like domain
MPSDIEARVKELEAKVLELTDREAIRDLRYRYHEYVNEGKFAQIPALFTDDGELDFAHLGKAKGPDELKRFFGALNESRAEAGNRPRITWVKQFIHNHIVHVRGDTGDGFAYLEAKPIFNGEAFLVAARYDDEYVKRNGEWKFKKMSLVPYFMVPFWSRHSIALKPSFGSRHRSGEFNKRLSDRSVRPKPAAVPDDHYPFRTACARSQASRPRSIRSATLVYSAAQSNRKWRSSERTPSFASLASDARRG